MREIAGYFISNEIVEQYRKIAVDLHLNEEQIPLLISDVYRFVSDDDSEEEFKNRVKERLMVDENQTAAILAILSDRIFGPVIDQIPELKEKILSWRKIIPQQISKKPEEAARTFVLRYSEDFDQQKLHRLERILTEYLERKLSKDQTIEMLGRPLKLAGLEMDPDFAREMLGELDSEFPRSVLDTFEEKDELEIKKLKEVRKDILQPTITSLEEVVTKICLQLPTIIANSKLADRCREIVSSRVHDVRDINQTREIISRSVEKGGLGITGDELENLVKIIEVDVQAFHFRKQKEVKKEQQEKLAERKERNEKLEQMKQKEQQLLTKRYVAMTGKIPSETVAPSAPSLTRASAAVSVENHLAQQAAKIDTRKVKQVIEKTLPPQYKPVQPLQKPKVQDVQIVRRLAGPVEELGSFDLEKFRRLSKEPAQAVQRIKDMIELLENQGFDKRVAGVKAFRSSPIYRQYTNVTQQALLSGKSVDSVLGDLKKEEYDALMKLNEEIRF